MQDFTNKKIVLGICGGIAAYKAAWLVRELTRLGALVKVAMTESAQQFIGALTLQALSGQEVRTSLFDAQAERAMGHIELAHWADYFLIAPASANCLAKLAQGMADDLLSTLYLVRTCPVIICPAMNQAMWHHPATQRNCDILRQDGVMVAGPEEGSQACGDYGLGRLCETDVIINHLRLFFIQNQLAGKTVLITAGPTWEPIDPVRYITNKSSGKMGYALAQAAVIAGARVILVSGPTSLPVPLSLNFYPVVTAQEMHSQVLALLQPDMIFIGCAAVADFSPEAEVSHKIKKQAQGLTLALTLNPDILAAVASSKKLAFVAGFAAETTDVISNARNKLHSKKLDMIIANKVGNGLGFDEDAHEAVVITQDKEIPLSKMHKVNLAGEIIAIIAASIQNAGHD